MEILDKKDIVLLTDPEFKQIYDLCYRKNLNIYNVEYLSFEKNQKLFAKFGYKYNAIMASTLISFKVDNIYAIACIVENPSPDKILRPIINEYVMMSISDNYNKSSDGKILENGHFSVFEMHKFIVDKWGQENRSFNYRNPNSILGFTKDINQFHNKNLDNTNPLTALENKINRINEINKSIKELRAEKNSLLDGNDLEDLQEQFVKEKNRIEKNMKIEKIRNEINKLTGEKSNMEIAMKNIDDRMEQFRLELEKYSLDC